MKWFRNLRIEAKLIGAFALVASIVVIVGIIGIRNMSTINDMADRIYERELLGISYIKQANIDLMYLQRNERNIIDATSEEERRKTAEHTETYMTKYLENIQKAEPLFSSEKGKDLFAKVEKSWGEYNPVRKQVIDLAMKEKLSEKTASIDLATGLERQKANALDDALTELTRQKEANAKLLSEEAANIYGYSRAFMVGLSTAGFFAGILLGVIMTLSITRPIKRVIEGLSEGAGQVSAASGQVSAAGQELAEGASEQAASIEETSASLEEMSSMTKQNAANSHQANDLMNETKKAVSQASGSMEKLAISMGEISRAGEETSKIIKAIDEIAFQTNLLALNAAVEAARAGEAGAGFAVVADEVRNLAMRAADAAKNTASLIEGTVKKVQEGSEIVQKTNAEFSQVKINAAKMGELIGEISAASVEQAQGIEQISKAVSEMDKVVQQNAASAEESAAAFEEMNAQAEQMRGFVVELVAIVVGGANGAFEIRKPKPANFGNSQMINGEQHLPGTSSLTTSKKISKSGNGDGSQAKSLARAKQTIPFGDEEMQVF